MSRRNSTNARTITLRVSKGKGVINIPVTIFCESNSVSAADHSQAAGRDLHGAPTAHTDNPEHERMMIEKNNRIIELTEHISELKDKIRTLEAMTPASI